MLPLTLGSPVLFSGSLRGAWLRVLSRARRVGLRRVRLLSHVDLRLLKDQDRLFNRAVVELLNHWLFADLLRRALLIHWRHHLAKAPITESA